MANRKRIYFTMARHPSGEWVRTGPAYSSRERATDWIPLVRGAWRGCKVRVSQCTLRYNKHGELTVASKRVLDLKFNMSPP